MYKLGVIGLGNHFIEHILHAIKLTHEVNVEMICDIDQEKINNALLYLPDAKTTMNWRDLFKADLDIVMCVSFPQLHEGVIESAIRNNIPAFVEKPPFVSVEGVRKLSKLKKEYNYRKPIGVGINFNFSSMANIVKNIVDTGEHGRVVEVDICHVSNKPDTDIWDLNNPLLTMLLSQAIHPLSLMTTFTDKLGVENISYIVSGEGTQSIIKLILPASRDGHPVAGTIRTGNFGPRFRFHMSITFEDSSRIECTPENIKFYDKNQPDYAGSNKWVSMWEAKTFMSGIEKGGYAQEIESFLEAVRDGDDEGMYSPDYYLEMYQIMDKVLKNEKNGK